MCRASNQVFFLKGSAAFFAYYTYFAFSFRNAKNCFAGRTFEELKILSLFPHIATQLKAFTDRLFKAYKFHVFQPVVSQSFLRKYGNKWRLPLK